MSDSTRHGAQQPHRFNPARAGLLDDSARFAYLPVADIVALLDLKAAATLLDFGAGTGAYAIEIARLRPDLQIIALEEQTAMLELLRANIATAGISTIAPIQTIEHLEPSRIDGVLALNVLHELGDAALADVRSLVAPGAVAAIIDWNGDIERPYGPPRGHVYGRARAQERLESCGLHVRRAKLFAYHYALVCSPAVAATS